MSRREPAPDARMDPWCEVTLAEGGTVLFGYVTVHPRTGGLAWTRTSSVLSLDAAAGRATTFSGSRYALGRRMEAAAVPLEGLEAWVAYDMMVSPGAEDGTAVPPVSADPLRDAMWLIACKIGRHLKVAAPSRAHAEVKAFLMEYVPAYVRLRHACGERQ